ncbi:MAG: hypothetical protein IPJ84_19085 [Bdellovibrionales bacterium]|nr:hypothetical protein [Bdellovibrionales bacterium]MBK7892875.1 hypothetical protein [Bdellovibrionales bacterium]
MKLKGAFFPEIRKVASEKLQIELGCSPEVAKIFHPSMRTDIIPDDSAVWIQACTLQQWEEYAGEWEHEAAHGFELEVDPPPAYLMH